MLQKLLMRSFGTVFASRPDISKASELVLTLDVYQEKANSGSPEFFVQEIVSFRITHPKNPKASESMAYEFVGHVVRRNSAGEITRKVKASLVCWQRAWSLLERNKPFTVVLCELCELKQKKRLFATASRRADCATFDVHALLPKKRGMDSNNLLL